MYANNVTNYGQAMATRKSRRSEARDRETSEEREPKMMADKILYRLGRNQYIHVLDSNTNVTRVEVGPQTLIRREHEIIIHADPLSMVVIPPAYYCVVENPVIRDPTTKVVVTDSFGQAKLSNGDKEYRFEQDPFPLYPGEVLVKKPTKMPVILINQALRLQAIVDFVDEENNKQSAGAQWYFKGPGTYYPRKEVEEIEIVNAVNIKRNEALRVRALRNCVDAAGKNRVAGEEWLVREVGSYLPGIDEEIVQHVQAYVLDENLALHLRATLLHEDQFGILRKAGDEWIVTCKQTDAYIPDVCQEVVKTITPVTLNSNNYCAILNHVDKDGVCHVGTKKIVRGPCSFFLQPKETLFDGVRDVYQLTENDGLILRCIDTMQGRQIGDMWLLRGPCEFVPSESIEVVHVRKAIALAENEGIYVKNMKDGSVRAVIGGNYMLTEEEELWEKEMPADVEALLTKDPLAERSMDDEVKTRGECQPREKYQVVRYRIPHNAACLIYDYRLKKSRAVFGPELVLLQPDEQFTLLSLSGGVPKRNNYRKALCLLLGPDYFQDVFTIETADHARLSLRVSLNWQFCIEGKSDEEKKKIFALPDFIGDACKVVASHIRGAVSSVPFDEFHKNSADIIHLAVFGKDENGKRMESYFFHQNFLTITSLDIISLEPVDQKTRDALQRTVQLAIEITTNAQEANAKHEAIRLQQEAEGRQIRQKLIDSIEAEKQRKLLIAQKIENTEIETCGQAIADAKSQSQAARIERESAVEQAKLEVEAAKIRAQNELDQLNLARTAELEYLQKKNALEVEKLSKQAEIEIYKFKEQVSAIGKDTLIAMASAGPEMKVKMLQALGLQSALITDGSTPINLLNTASGLVDLANGQKKSVK